MKKQQVLTSVIRLFVDKCMASIQINIYFKYLNRMYLFGNDKDYINIQFQ